MNKYLILIVAVVVLTVVGLFLWQKDNVGIPAPTAENTVFDANTVKAGDTVGFFKVVRVTPFEPQVPAGADNIKVYFSGNITIQGIYREIETVGPIVDGLDVSGSDRVIPRQQADVSRPSACLENLNPKDSGIKEGDKVSVKIDQYTYMSYPAGGCSGIFQVVSIEKI